MWLKTQKNLNQTRWSLANRTVSIVSPNVDIASILFRVSAVWHSPCMHKQLAVFMFIFTIYSMYRCDSKMEYDSTHVTAKGGTLFLFEGLSCVFLLGNVTPQQNIKGFSDFCPSYDQLSSDFFLFISMIDRYVPHGLIA